MIYSVTAEAVPLEPIKIYSAGKHPLCQGAGQTMDLSQESKA